MEISNIVQTVKANIQYLPDRMDIAFSDDPSFTRAETVLLDLMHRSVGVIFDHGYHHIGELPFELTAKDLGCMTKAKLSGHGEMGREIVLHAPIKLVR